MITRRNFIKGVGYSLIGLAVPLKFIIPNTSKKINKSGLTLLELSKRYDSSKNLNAIEEILNERNKLLDDLPWKESDSVRSVNMTRRSTLPKVTWREL